MHSNLWLNPLRSIFQLLLLLPLCLWARFNEGPNSMAIISSGNNSRLRPIYAMGAPRLGCVSWPTGRGGEGVRGKLDIRFGAIARPSFDLI